MRIERKCVDCNEDIEAEVVEDDDEDDDDEIEDDDYLYIVQQHL